LDVNKFVAKNCKILIIGILKNEILKGRLCLNL